MSKESTKPFLKNCIFNALMILMEQKDYDAITITDIANKAGVSRMSYYRTYSSKDDILLQYIDELFENCLEEFRHTPHLTQEQFYLKFFETFLQNRTLISNLLRTNLYGMVLDYFVKCLKYLAQDIYGLDASEPYTDYLIHSEAGSLSVVAIHWIETGAKEAPREMAKLFTKLKQPDLHPTALT